MVICNRGHAIHLTMIVPGSVESLVSLGQTVIAPCWERSGWITFGAGSLQQLATTT